MSDDKTNQRVDRIAEAIMGHDASSAQKTTKVMGVAIKVGVGLIGAGLGVLALVMLWRILGVILDDLFDSLWP